MKIHKIALLASISILSMNELLAASADNGRVVQPATQAIITMPTQKVMPHKTVKPLGVGKLGIVTTGNKVAAPKHQSKLKRIELLSSQQLLLTNGKLIVRNGNSGFNIIGANNAVHSSYKNASLFKDNKKSIWIKIKGRQQQVGILARIKTSNVIARSSLGLKATLHADKLINNKAVGNTTVRPGKTKPNASLHNYQQPQGSVQGNSGGTTSKVEVEKGMAGEFENFEEKAKKFRWFNVALDSVVATATVVVDDNHRTLSINWGDGEVETLNLLGMNVKSTTANEHQTNQSDAFKFRHVYKTPLDGTKKMVTISARNFSGRVVSVSSTEVDINARYKFSMYSVILEFPDHLDSSFESHSEIEGHMLVKQGGEAFYNRRWKKSVLTAPSVPTTNNIEWKLPQSHLSREIARLDDYFEIYLSLKEIDGVGKSSSTLEFVWGVVTAPFKGAQYVYEALSSVTSFDGSNWPNRAEMPLKIHPETTIGSNNSNRATVIYSMGTKEGNIIAHFSYDLKLIVPANPASGPSPVMSMN